MTEIRNPKQYDLEDRCFKFARGVRGYVKNLPRNSQNLEDGKQLIRSSGSVGANYIEANESLSKKDFLMRIKICRKEAKESEYWLKLTEFLETQEGTQRVLVQEAAELRKIFGSILEKSKRNNV